VLRILSGGQTGVDRAALDVAFALGIPAGGWCPAGRAAEDGPIPARYTLRETTSPDPAARTARNVLEADVTLIISPLPLAGGTALAARIASDEDKPLVTLDPDGPDVAAARERLLRAGPVTLNVAGPRESEAPGIARRAARLLVCVLAGGT
jgi:hypothetical protein